MIKWQRREKGSYIANVNSVRITIVDAAGDGPRAPAMQGEAKWEVREGGEGPYDIGAKQMHNRFWTLADAKTWVEKEYS